MCYKNAIYSGDVLPIGNMVINRIADMRRVAGLRHRFDTEQPTLLDLELVNNRSSSSSGSSAHNKLSAAPLHTAADSCSRNGDTPPVKPQFGLRWKMFELDNCDGKLETYNS